MGIFGEKVEGIDVLLAVAVEAEERQVRAVGAEGRVAGFDQAVANDIDDALRTQVEIDLLARRILLLQLGPLQRSKMQVVRIA